MARWNHFEQVYGVYRTVTLQNKEYAAIEDLAQKLIRLRQVSLTDHYYPVVRGDYESAAEAVLEAFTANGRRPQKL